MFQREIIPELLLEIYLFYYELKMNYNDNQKETVRYADCIALIIYYIVPIKISRLCDLLLVCIPTVVCYIRCIILFINYECEYRAPYKFIYSFLYIYKCFNCIISILWIDRDNQASLHALYVY